VSKHVPVSIEQTDGRVSMSLSGTLGLHVKTPRNKPLSKIETQATIVVAGPTPDADNRVEIELDAGRPRRRTKPRAPPGTGRV